MRSNAEWHSTRWAPSRPDRGGIAADPVDANRIGKRHFQRALAAFPHRDGVTVTWRSFQLDPSAPVSTTGDPTDRLAERYGMSRAQADAAPARVTAMAAGEGLDFHLEQARSGNTFDAHRLIHYAASVGEQDAMKERFMAAYFVEGEAVGERDVLTRVATTIGLDETAVHDVLNSGAYDAEVRHDELEAGRLGITGVPFFVIDRTYGLSGAQSPETIGSALQQAWSEAHPPQMVTGVHVYISTDDRCTI